MDIQVLQGIKDNFISELERANAGEATSLPYIVHQMPVASLVKDGEEFQVIIIGGTYAVSAKVQKKADTCIILTQEKSTLPQLSTQEDFFQFVNSILDMRVDVLALNFAFPIKPVFENGRLDGELLTGSKGHVFTGLVGKKVGQEVERFIHQKSDKKITVSVANDTVCLLLSGLEKVSYESLGAGIVGTGMNFAFFLSENKLVNLESADFDKFPKSNTGMMIDQSSVNVGKSLFEKEVAGVYLYKHYNLLLKSKNISAHAILSTQELDRLARENKNEEGDIARELFNRSAKLIACQTSAIMEFRKTDMTFVMEGSLFWKGFRYKETVEETLESLTDYKAEFIEVKDSGIVGAAHLVM